MVATNTLKKTRAEAEQELSSTTDTLALRYRPKTLKEVVGQDAAKKTLTGMFKNNRAPNAIMLVGTTGVGKTTLARLIGRYLNCSTGNACNKCGSCINMNAVNRGAGDHPDYLEVNASESGNIETVRKLIESSRYIPENRLRIFMLDEIHRASHAAIQALLVPVETPPSRTLWIFSTSEPGKIPNGKALMGRCTMLSLAVPNKSQIKARLLEIGEKEKMKWLTKKIASIITEYSEGHVRNALQMLEKASLLVSGSKEQLDSKELAKAIEGVSLRASGDDLEGPAFNLLKSLYDGNRKRLVRTCLSAPDIMALIGRAIMVNGNLMSLSVVGKHEGLWKSKAVIALESALKLKGANTSEDLLRVSGITARLLEIREGLLTIGQNYPVQWTVSQLMALTDQGRHPGRPLR